MNRPYLLQQNTEVGIFFLAYISYHDELERSFLTAQKAVFNNAPFNKNFFTVWLTAYYNGDLTQDLNKGIENIQYNCLNLPRLVKFKDQSTITYTYAADGTKLRVEHKIGNSTTRTTYCSNVIYEDGTAKCVY